MKFSEYYKYYLTLHRNKWNRRLHALGQLATILFIALSIQQQQWFLLFFTPLIVYPFAWSGHFFFEKNKPAAWSRPLWAKACDWLMLKDMIIGKLER
jgi:hypothetical protein